MNTAATSSSVLAAASDPALPIAVAILVLACVLYWAFRLRWRPVRVVGVVDGDTVLAIEAAGSPPVSMRLVGIDAPERGQRHSRDARLALKALIADTDAWVRRYGTDRYGRAIVKLRTAQTRDVGLEMVRRGLAWPTADRGRRPEWRYRYAGFVAGLTLRGARTPMGVSPMSFKRSGLRRFLGFVRR